MASVLSGSATAACEIAKEKESDNMCTVCMECIPEKIQCKRPCGHMMCASCDVAWQSRGKIEEFKMQRKDKKSKENIMVYMTVSNCPSCRRKDAPHDYHGRSKVSMFHEIQMLTRTLYLSGIRAPMSYASKFNQMDETTAVTPPPPPVHRPDIFTPPPVLRRADAFDPYIPPMPPMPFINTPVFVFATTTQTSGICCRRVQGCNTTRTKLRCVSCQRVLCRSCRGTGCVCQSP